MRLSVVRCVIYRARREIVKNEFLLEHRRHSPAIHRTGPGPGRTRTKIGRTNQTYISFGSSSHQRTHTCARGEPPGADSVFV